MVNQSEFSKNNRSQVEYAINKQIQILFYSRLSFISLEVILEKNSGKLKKPKPTKNKYLERKKTGKSYIQGRKWRHCQTD